MDSHHLLLETAYYKPRHLRVSMQNLNILMLGAKDGKGGFFPKGIQGRINNPQGFDVLSPATEDWTGKAAATQVTALFTCTPHMLAQCVGRVILTLSVSH